MAGPQADRRGTVASMAALPIGAGIRNRPNRGGRICGPRVRRVRSGRRTQIISGIIRRMADRTVSGHPGNARAHSPPLSTRAAEVLFLDDNWLNVEAAREIGMQAARVRGPGEAEI